MTDDPSLRQREIAAEQRHVDRVYDELGRRRVEAAQARDTAYAVQSVGNAGALVERDAMVFRAAKRLGELDAQHEGLVFGRLDLAGDIRRYVGRIGLLDSDFEPLVVDWRAPVAAPFYRATAADPADVRRRRVIRTAGQRVIDIEDDLFAGEGDDADLAVVGEGALMAALGRARTSGMQDIVATIQREQDVAIRASAAGVTTITGGPGTGKTAVATHRAAYLLYQDRRRYEGGGVLIVGPSSVFISYIERVLPSLGESSVSLRALGEVMDNVSATHSDSAEVAAVKGSLTMCTFLRRAARDTPPGAPDLLRTTYAGVVLELDGRRLAAARRAVTGAGRPVNQARPAALRALVDGLWQRRPRDAGWDRQHFGQEIRERPAVREFLAAWWPPLRPEAVLGWCAHPDRAQRYGADVLSASDLGMLLSTWRPGVGPSTADVALLDELRTLLGEAPAAPPPEDDPSDDETLAELWTVADRELVARRRVERPDDYDGYAHIVVDEFQDVSPMQWRMLGRRGPSTSWTLVGDPAQSAWDDVEAASSAREAALGRGERRTFRLGTNYRNPREIFELAAAVLRRVDPAADLPDPVRATGTVPQHLVAALDALPETVRAAAAHLLAAVDGTVGVVAPTGRGAAVRAWLAGLADDRLQVVEAPECKGMEYDGVVAVEPDVIRGGSARGTRALYVVLTRATQRLVTVGSTQDWLRK